MSESPPAGIPEDDFWGFSLRVYGHDPVRRACIKLQDQFRCDVNLLLFCCWCGAEGPGDLNAAFVKSAAEHVAPWNDDVVKHLRVTRWVVGRGFDEVDDVHTAWLRERILSAEIDAEQVEQLMLSRLVADRPRPASGCGPSAVARNLVNYLRLLDVEPNDVIDDALSHLIAGVFPDLSARSARGLLVWT